MVYKIAEMRIYIGEITSSPDATLHHETFDSSGSTVDGPDPSNIGLVAANNNYNIPLLNFIPSKQTATNAIEIRLDASGGTVTSPVVTMTFDLVRL